MGLLKNGHFHFATNIEVILQVFIELDMLRAKNKYHKANHTLALKFWLILHCGLLRPGDNSSVQLYPM